MAKETYLDEKEAYAYIPEGLGFEQAGVRMLRMIQRLLKTACKGLEQLPLRVSCDKRVVLPCVCVRACARACVVCVCARARACVLCV